MYHAAKLVAFTAFLAVSSSVGVARAQTWTNGQETPRMLDLVEIDRCGEGGWPFGNEDVAGDGTQLLTAEEARHDLRSVYANTDSGRFWLRIYVSASDTPPDTLTAYLFVDADGNSSTGGPATGEELDPRLSEDPSAGGYEYAVAMPAADTAPTVWSWNEAAGTYGEAQVTPAQASLECAQDTDPLLIGDDIHGYVQLEIESNVIDVADACGVDLFVRSTSDSAAVEPGDLELGDKSACVAPDANSDRIPDPSVPQECDSSDDCPWNGLCVDGNCLLPRGCDSARDCDSDEICTVDGHCVVAGGAACETAADCDGLICDDGECVACVPDADECDADSVCGPDGRCVPASGIQGTGGRGGQSAEGDHAGNAGIALAEDEEVTGGAFRCSVEPAQSAATPRLAVLVTLGLLGQRRRRRGTAAKCPTTRNA